MVKRSPKLAEVVSTLWLVLAHVAGATSAPSPVAVTPASGSGLSQTFTFTYTDPAGYAAIQSSLLLINKSLSVGGCYLYYGRASNSVYLMNDAANQWLGPISPGQAATVQNSQCAINGATSSASGSGTTLTLSLAITFQSSFAESKIVAMEVTDGANDSGWIKAGTWTVPSSGLPSPSGVSPGSGSGLNQTFAFTYTDPAGFGAIQSSLLLINKSLSVGGCYLYYGRAGNSLYLLNDAANQWLGPINLGQAGTVQNSECAINGATSSASGSGTTLTLSLAITFQSSFAGSKIVAMEVTDGTNDSGWIKAGTWTVPPAGVPSPLGVSPASGSGLSQTYAFAYTDPAGYAAIQSSLLVINKSLSDGGCYIYYGRAGNSLYLLNDAANQWLGPISPGQAGTVQNSQCAINGATSRANGSGTTLTLNLAITFQSSFGGNKIVAMEVYDGVNDSGWIKVGTWTVPLPAVITANVKGPDQINLAWPATSAGYGYIVFIQSSADTRYSSWTPFAPIPPATGYTCNSTITINSAICNISDSGGAYIYNPPNPGVPYWVTEPNYVDPQDSTAAQFIAAGLLPNTTYAFYVETYSLDGSGNTIYGTSSNTVMATTSTYPLLYVSPTGNDSNTGASPAAAWQTLAHASSQLQCGQELIIGGGSYTNDYISFGRSCPQSTKAILFVMPGTTATLGAGAQGVDLWGSGTVVDGLTTALAAPGADNYDLTISGSHNALFNMNVGAASVPNQQQDGIQVVGRYNLVYGCYVHDYGSPDAVQNPSGNSGELLTVQGTNAAYNVIWANHLTRGGHDSTLAVNGAGYNKWLDNVMDGGWSMGWEDINTTSPNLFEGNFVFQSGQLVSFYKPGNEVSAPNITVRRNIFVSARRWGQEVSGIEGNQPTNSLIYNNTWYMPDGCLYQADSGTASAYVGDLFSNNICYKITQAGGTPYGATEMYTGQTAQTVSFNSFIGLSGSSPVYNPQTIIWYQDIGGSNGNQQTPQYSDTNYSPPFSHNSAFSVNNPQFVNEAGYDFHLSGTSAFTGAGTSIKDSNWGSASGAVSLGAFGIPTPF